MNAHGDPTTPASTKLVFDYARLTGSGDSGVPFSSHTGVVVESFGPDGATAWLEEAPHTLNHVGSQHGGAVFTLGGAAAGAAVSGAFGEGLDARLAVAKRAEIDFLRIARGRLTARASLLDERGRLQRELAEKGRASFKVGVSVSDPSGAEVARLQFAWELRPARP